MAPFNSTIDKDSELGLVPGVPMNNKMIRYDGKVREVNRQYEFNYNGEVDNGIIISHESEEAAEAKKNLRDELRQSEIFKKQEGMVRTAMVSPNTSKQSLASESQKSLKNFIDMQCKQNFVINDDKLSSYKTDSPVN